MNLVFIRSTAKKILAATPVRKAFLFGSAARGEGGPNSDLDILVELDSERKVGLIEFIKIQMKLEEAFHTRVDLISSDGLSPHIRPFIEKDKMLIYEA
jgi:predicted nucleotidyltransferase